MKRLAIAMMCLLMCFSTVMPTTALAKKTEEVGFNAYLFFRELKF